MAIETDSAYLANKYMDMVYRIALCQLKSPADSDDVTQNVMLRLIKNRKGFESEEHAKSWLIRVALNESKRLLSSSKRQHAALLEDCEGVPVYQSEEQRELLETVMSLPPKYRIVIHLHYFEGYTAFEIGRLLGISETAVTTRLMRAREKLRETLTAGGAK